MGIKNLFSIIKDEAPDAIKEGEIKNQFGRKVAIVSCSAHDLVCMWLLLTIHRMRTNSNPMRKTELEFYFPANPSVVP